MRCQNLTDNVCDNVCQHFFENFEDSRQPTLIGTTSTMYHDTDTPKNSNNISILLCGQLSREVNSDTILKA
jgi:hypothetical protein